MQNCIQETVNLIDQRIISLQSLRESLLSLDSNPASIAIENGGDTAELKKTTAAKSYRQRNNGGSSVAAAVRSHKPGGRGQRGNATVEAARTLSQPFRTSELARMAGISLKGAESQVYRWFGAGLITKDAPGQWRITAKFPQPNSAPAANPSPRGISPAKPSPPVAAAAPRASLAGLSLSELEKKLQDACKQRDHARANGRDAMEEIFQKDIDQLERQIESVNS